MGQLKTSRLIFEKMCFPKIILYSLSIKTDDRWRFDATCSLRSPGRLPDWQPPDHLNILKGVEKHPVDDKWYIHLVKSVSGSIHSSSKNVHSC